MTLVRLSFRRKIEESSRTGRYRNCDTDRTTGGRLRFLLKGLSKRTIIWRHALRNALIAPFTAIMLHVNWLIGGVVVVEVLFNYPGLGRLLLDAALRNDIVLLEGGTLVLTFVAVTSQVIGDIGIYFMNPRIRFGDR